MHLNGGTLLASTLAEVAPVIFTLHGGHLDSFLKGCVQEGVELLDFRHEAAAVNAADGYARVTGGLGVAAVTSGPGFANGFAGITALSMSGGGTPDMVMLLGFPLSLFSGGRPGPGGAVPADARLIQVDADAAEIGRLAPVDVAVQADGAETLAALLAAHEGPWPDHGEWAEKVVSAHRLMDLLYADAPQEIDGRIHPYHAAKQVLSALDPGSIIVADGGETAGWVSFALAAAEPELVLNPGYQGHLGIGQGIAIGAQRAEPGRRVVQITGDGAIGFHIQELDTMVRHELPVVTVVMANDAWGMSIHGQDVLFGKGNDIISRLAPTAYEKVAQAFGAHGERVEKLGELGPAVRRALDSGRPALVNVAVSNEVVHPMTTMMLGDVTATDEIVVPYYQNIPLK